jgi:lipoprotein LprG
MTRRLPALAGLLAALLLVAAGCGGASTKASTKPPAERLAAAKKIFDKTSGVAISLKAKQLPSSVAGVLSADGIGTHQPAFQGNIRVFQSGLALKVPIVAVDNKVYVSFGTWQEVDPSQYNAPDPAALMDPTTGLSTLLTQATNLKAGSPQRSGSSIVTDITGTVPGSAVAQIIPSALDQDFAATFTLDGTNHLTKAVLTGKFYPKVADVTYTFTFSNYGTSTTVKAP